MNGGIHDLHDYNDDDDGDGFEGCSDDYTVFFCFFFCDSHDDSYQH